MKKILLNLLKFAVAASIIGYLVYDVVSDPKKSEDLANVIAGPKDWRLFGAAFALFFVAVCLTFIRWLLLVRALDFPFTVGMSFRLGFMGYLFNFVVPGGVGGDLVKAVFIAHHYHGRRAQAVATVLIDRIVGLYALFVVASIVVLADGLWYSDVRAVRLASQGTLAGAVIGAIGIIMLLIPGFTQGRMSKSLTRLPRVGRTFKQLLDAVRMYRSRLGNVVLSLLLSMVVHGMTVIGFFLLSKAIPGQTPTLGELFVIIPLAMVVGAVPITPGGLGTMELAIEKLFPIMTQGAVSGDRGLLLALIFRVITIVIALIGGIFYATMRREMTEVIHEAEEEETADEAK